MLVSFYSSIELDPGAFCRWLFVFDLVRSAIGASGGMNRPMRSLDQRKKVAL